MTEQQPYEVVQQHDGFELRRYPAHLVAEVEVEGSFTDAGNRAFGVLVGFIGGRNTASSKVAMTAPVLQEAASTKIAMTAPVVQEPGTDTGRHVVGFVMPAAYSPETLPTPADPRIRIRTVPEHLAAARRFSGRWSEQRHDEEAATLLGAVTGAGFTATGPVRFARFDPPWTPWFLRRNEVVVPVTKGAEDVAA